MMENNDFEEGDTVWWLSSDLDDYEFSDDISPTSLELKTGKIIIKRPISIIIDNDDGRFVVECDLFHSKQELLVAILKRFEDE